MSKVSLLRSLLWPLASDNSAWQCGGCTTCDTDAAGAEDVQVQLLSTDCGAPQPGHQRHHKQHVLQHGDALDFSQSSPVTPRQRSLQGRLELPALESYPTPPDCRGDEDEELQRRRLLDMYQGFAMELHRGMYLTQLMADRTYSDIHCQLMEDMMTLKLDQSNGRIIEFPLANVSKVYRLTKSAGKWYPAERHTVPHNAEQIIVVVFSKRKLAFVFKELKTCHRFMLCLELLIWRAQQYEGVSLLKSSYPCRPSQQEQLHERQPQHHKFSQTPQSGPCPTPRLVRDSEAPPKPHCGDWREGEGTVDGPSPEEEEEASAPASSSRTPGPPDSARCNEAREEARRGPGGPAQESSVDTGVSTPGTGSGSVVEDVDARDQGLERENSQATSGGGLRREPSRQLPPEEEPRQSW